MKRIILVLTFVFWVIFSYSQTNKIVTEYYLANTFTPKSGITPGSNNTLAMDCDQITNRYNVSIAGVSSTGHRLPSQSQLSSSLDYAIYFKSFDNNISNSTTINRSITVDSDATFLIICVKTVSGSDRQVGTPTWNGVSMTQVGNTNGQGYFTEIWYLANPATGTHALSIQNSTASVIHTTASWYKCSRAIRLYTYNTGSGTSTTPSVMLTSADGWIIHIDSVVFRENGSNTLGLVSNSNAAISFGVNGAIFGSATQYGILLNPTSPYYLQWTIANPMVWVSLGATFISD